MNQQKISTRNIVILGLLLALKIVFARFFNVPIGDVTRMNLAFIINGIIGYIYGPWIGAGMGAIGDILGFMVSPSSGAFFPGYTLSAALAGGIYGFFLYNKKGFSFVRIVIATSLVSLGCNIILGTCWLTFLTGKTFIALLPVRVLKNIILLPIESIVLSVVLKYLSGYLKRFIIQPAQ